jgi:competence protein ComEC
VRLSALLLPAALGGAALGILAADAGIPLGGTLAAPLAAIAAGAFGIGQLMGPRIRIATVVLLLGTGVAVLGAWRGGATALPTGADSVSALVGREWTWSGTLTDDPRPRGERQQLVLDDLLLARGDQQRAVRGRVLVWLPRTAQLAVGDRVRVTAKLEEPQDFDGFAYREYLARQGIGGIARAFDVTVVGQRVSPLVAITASARRWLLGGLNEIVPEPEAALGAGILLGVRAGIAPEVADAFAAAGLTHVVAISGWNIAIVAALVAAFLRPMARRRGGRLLGSACTIAAIGGYVLLTGASPSVVRAALMAGAILVARVEGSPAHAASALMLAALGMLLVAPPVLWDVGFQLSLLATAGLIVFAGSIERRLHGWPPLLREPLALTAAAQLATLPVIVGNFERLSLVAPLANVVVTPIVPLAMLASAIAAVVGALDGAVHLPLLGDAAAWLAAGWAWLTLRAMIVAGTSAAALPLASIPWQPPGLLLAGWYPLLGVGWLIGRRRRRRVEPASVELGLAPAPPPRKARLPVELLRRFLRPRWLLLASVGLLAVISLVSLPDGRLHLIALDIGQGDAILIESPTGRTVLIDGGPDPDLTLRRLGANLPFFQRRIDLMLLTHPHQDHIAGLVEVMARFRVGMLIHAGIPFDNPAYPRLLADARHEPGLRLVLGRAGQRLPIDETTSLEIIYPTAADAAGALPDGDINNASIVAVLRSGGFVALLTGDAEAPIEARLAERGLLDPVDVLKVGHHGSRSGTTARLLELTRPAAALISVGTDNEYGHPAAVTLATLARQPGLRVHRTDLEGDLQVVSDGRAFSVRSLAGLDPLRPVRAMRAAVADPGSIGPWPFPISTAPGRSSSRTRCPTGSSTTRRGCGGSRRRRRGWWRPRTCRSTSGSSRSPPCCTTSTSCGSSSRVASMGSWVPLSSRSWATPNSPCRSPRTR